MQKYVATVEIVSASGQLIKETFCIPSYCLFISDERLNKILAMNLNQIVDELAFVRAEMIAV